MSLQEQEHWDHEAGRASEWQNCFTEAQQRCSELHYQQQVKIQAKLAAKLFVVVEDCPYHCKATDAVAGNVTYFRSAHFTREGAEAASNCREGYENGFYVLPRVPAPAVAPAPCLPQDDVPF